MDAPLIEFKNVYKRFEDNQVLRGIDLRVYKGQITTVIGKSGGGKSVLLKHVIGLLKQDSGEILFEGRPLHTHKRAERARLKRKFSYLFQGGALFDSLSVFDNVAMPLRERTKLKEADIKRRVEQKIALLDLAHAGHKFPSELSGGMLKRVGLARALVTDPEIVLFDEPTTGLDPIRKNAVHSMISDYQKRFGFTGVVVSHEIPDVFFISQRVAMLDEGRILIEGTPEEVQQSPDKAVQQFIHGLESGRDELTGMATQIRGERRLSEEMARLQGHQIAFSLVMLTIENLDEINKAMGHIVGQTVLKNFAGQIQGGLRKTDTCSRYGLNKIMIVFPGTDQLQAKALCTEMAQKINGGSLVEIKPSPGFCFRVSAGIAQAKENRTMEEAVNEAEARQTPFYEFNVC